MYSWLLVPWVVTCSQVCQRTQAKVACHVLQAVAADHKPLMWPDLCTYGVYSTVQSRL